MPLSALLLSFRRRTVWLFAVGLLAMAMQALGGTGLIHGNPAGEGIQIEICTSKGLGKADQAQLSGSTPLPGSDQHDCCKLCGASVPLLTAEAAPGVPPAPTFPQVFFVVPFLRPAAFAWVPHAPRGPPPV